MSVSTVRPLNHAERGALGGRKRWKGHEARTIRLDALTPEQRRLILALVAAAKNEKADADRMTAPATEVQRVRAEAS